MSRDDQTLTADQPTFVGPYAILGALGGGGMGVVFRARAPDGRLAALKVMHDRLSSQQAIDRFLREQQIRIEHPNVVRTLDAGIDDAGRPYLALELLEGEPLDARLRRRMPSPSEAARLVAQAARGLAAVHAQAIVHRDVKPSNLFVCADGTLKLLDFGVALMSLRETRLTNLGAIVGTPAYLSPEQASGKPVDARSDVWSLGAVLYEALAGRPPFERETALATVVAVLMEPVPSLDAPGRRLPPELTSIVARCLEKDASRRFASASELADALDALDLRSQEAVAPTERPPAPESLLEGEQRVVAVLYAEGVRDRAQLEGAIRKHGGRALELAGGRMLGVFGGEGWEGDETRRAAFAAVEARQAAIAVGVAAGSAARRGQGIGGAVLEAAREGAESHVDGVWVAANLVRSLQPDVVLRQLAPDRWEIVGRSDSGRTTVAEPSTPIVGRDGELTQLRMLADGVARERRARVVRISGPAGIGKTRLQTEIVRHVSASRRFPSMLFGRAEPLERDRALSLIAGMLTRRAEDLALGARKPGLQADLPLETRRQAVLRLAEEAAPSKTRAAELAVFLGEILGVPMPETAASRAAAADPRLMADRMRLAAQDYLDGRCSSGPVALFLDDVQWADGASLEVLRGALDLLVDAPLLVVATQRTESTEAPPLPFPSSLVVEIRLEGLGRDDVATLAVVSAAHEVSERLVDMLVERTTGNPFFVEQIVLELRDSGKLRTDPGSLPLPFNVEAAIQTRLDHLPMPEKEATKIASVIGRPFVEGEIESLLGDVAGALLRELRRRDVLVRLRTPEGEPRYAFRSDLVREVAYRMLGPEARGALHRKLASVLSRRTLAEPEEVALHLEQGGQPAEAAELLVGAALAAARRGDGPSVLRCSDRAFALAADVNASYALRMARAEALGFLGRRDEQAVELALALDAARTPIERARSLAQQGALLARTG
ncbi:MAG: protein kinase, partial [Deltaproteobacteria bacterium]|nr:protein kinase [Deltaproteobacteria bacterium]